uniref:Uncharacterized protein n=1 Tax=Arundo donax TaxID=35708 RepID=A0A0A9DER3_ARUDO
MTCRTTVVPARPWSTTSQPDKQFQKRPCTCEKKLTCHGRDPFPHLLSESGGVHVVGDGPRRMARTRWPAEQSTDAALWRQVVAGCVSPREP